MDLCNEKVPFHEVCDPLIEKGSRK